MKLATFFISSVFSYSPVTDVRGPDERYIYEKPLCSSVSQCSDLEGCDGKIFTGKTGEIELNGYQNHFSCRWEVRGPAGSKIKVFFRWSLYQILILRSKIFSFPNYWLPGSKVNRSSQSIRGHFLNFARKIRFDKL